MGHDEAGAALHHPGEGVLNPQLGAGVDGGGGLVQNQHRRQAQHHAGDAQQLLLALGQHAAVLADDGVIAVGQSADEGVGVGGLRGGDHLLVGGVGLAHDDVLPDGAGLQPGVLQHHAVGGAQAVARHVADVAALDADAAGIHVVKAHQQVDDGGLAAAGGADDGDALARLHGQVEVADQLLLRVVGERHVAALHAALHAGERQRVGPVGRLRRFGDQVQKPRGAGDGILKLRDHAGDLVERLGILVGVAEKAGQRAHGHAAGQRHQRAGQCHAGIDHAVDESGGGVGDGGEEYGAQRAVLQPAVDLVKLVQALRLAAEGLDHLGVADHLVDVGGHLATGLGLQAEHVVCALGDEPRHEQRQRRDHHHHQRDGPVADQHDDQRSGDGQRAGEQLCEAHQQALGELVGVGDDAADDLAVRMGVDVAQRQLGDLAQRVLAQIPHHVERDAVVDDVHQPLDHGGGRHADQDAGEDGHDGGEVHAGIQNLVDGVARQHGHIQRQRHGDAGQQEGQEGGPLVLADVFEHLLQNGPVHACAASSPYWDS